MTVTRADGTLTASGYAVSNATKYHATYSSDNKQSWTSASDSHTGNSITISGADNSKTYVVGVRAGNAGGWSGWTNSDAVAPFVPAPTNLIITNGDGFFDLAWSTVTDATGYDVRAKINNSASRTSVATGLTTNSYRYTTSDVVNKLAVRATNASGSSTWTELSRGPNDSWLNTVQQSCASAQSVQGQSQLAAPASITVTRENNSRDEKLYVSWPAVSGASGYNLACAASPSTQPMTSLSWWHCGSVTSGPTTTFTVDRDKRGGFRSRPGLSPRLRGRRARRDQQPSAGKSLDNVNRRASGTDSFVCDHVGVPRRRLRLDFVGTTGKRRWVQSLLRHSREQRL